MPTKPVIRLLTVFTLLCLAACTPNSSTPTKQFEHAQDGAFAASLSYSGQFAVVSSLYHGVALWDLKQNGLKYIWQQTPEGDAPTFEDAEDIEGYVLRSEILTAARKDEFEVVLSEIKKPLVSISVTSNVDSALDKFLQNKEQIALVKDEFGGTAGIVTMEDVVETLLGEEIVDELDEVEDMRELAMEKAKSVEEE